MVGGRVADGLAVARGEVGWWSFTWECGLLDADIGRAWICREDMCESSQLAELIKFGSTALVAVI